MSEASNSTGHGTAVEDGVGDEQDSSRRLALAIVEGAMDKKALSIEVIDVREKVDYTDYVVVMSGRSGRQVGAIAKAVQQHVKQALGVHCLGVEGLPQGQWALLDFGDVVVHVFHEDTRGYYDIESLWMDAARLSSPADEPGYG